jgi:nickel transport protein
MMKIILTILAITVSPVSLLAHGVHSSVEEGGPAVVILIRYGDGSPFSYEQYEVFGPGDDVPYMNGRSDANGRVLFAPDRDGEWRVRFFSHDGHGGERIVPFSAIARSGDQPDPASDRLLRLTAGLGYLTGIFGIALFFLRKTTASTGEAE